MSEVVLRFQAKDDGLTAQFRRVNEQLDQFGSQARGIADSISGSFKAAGIAGIATAAANAIKAMIDAGLEFGDSIQKVREQTGFTAAEVQKLNLAAGLADIELGSAATAALKLQKVLGGLEEGGSGAADMLARLNLNTQAFQNSSPAQQFDAVARAIAGIADQNERVAAATALFGKSGGELLPIIIAMGKESDELEAKLALIGGPTGADVIDKVDKIGDEMKTTAIAAKSLSAELLALTEPTTSAVQSKIQEGIGALRYELFGAQDEAGKLDDRMRELYDIVNNPIANGSIFDTDETFRKRVEAARKELERLSSQWNALHGFGKEGIAPPMSAVGVNIPMPHLGADQFQESDEARKEREKLEAEQIQQRLQHVALMHQIEEDMEFKHQQKLADISDAALADEANRQLDHEQQVLHIKTAAEQWMDEIRHFYGVKRIELEDFNAEHIVQTSAQMFTALATHSKLFAKIAQGLALAQAIWNTATAITNALATYPYPYNLVVAAIVGLEGLVQIQKIRATNFSPGGGGGSAPSVPGGGGSTPQFSPSLNGGDQTTTAQAQQGTTVYINGFINDEVIRQLIDGLRKGFDRDVVIVPFNSAQAKVIRGQTG